MKKPEFNVETAAEGLAAESAGFAHAINLLLHAIGKSNPAVGALLDEFTSMHAEYLAELKALAKDSDEYLQAAETFSVAAKLIYKRLSALDSEQSATLRAASEEKIPSVRLH